MILENYKINKHLPGLSLTNGRGSWVVGTSRGSWVVGVGVGEELIMIIHMKLIATFALCRIALR